MDSDSQHEDAVNSKTNGDTVLQWINLLREIGIMNDQNTGRSSVPDNRAGGWLVDGSASSIPGIRAPSLSVCSASVIPERSFCGNERSRATSGIPSAREKRHAERARQVLH